MKKHTLSATLLSLSLPFLAISENNGILYNCEEFDPHGYPHGWGFWCDKQSRKPDWKVVSDAAEGRQALQITFHGCKKFQGVSINLPSLPQNAESFTFWIKNISGKPPSNLELVEVSADGKGREFFTASPCRNQASGNKSPFLSQRSAIHDPKICQMGTGNSTGNAKVFSD